MTAEITFPRQQARTLRFSLGTPHSFAIAPDGSRIAFLRSRSGTDRVNCLWVRDVASGAERVVADPAVLLDGASEDLPPEERARRERVRQGGEGVVAFATDSAVSLAVFTLSGRLFTVGLSEGTVQEITSVTGPVVDPRPDPGGAHIAYVSGGALRVVAADGSGDRALAEPEGPDISYGLAEFVAAEEMARTRGYWWSPDGQSLLIARVDVSAVVIWHVSDPASPERPATSMRYPVAGTANADVTLILAGLDGSRRPVPWDTAAFPYLTSVHWSKQGPALIQIQTRDQRTVQVLTVAAGGGTAVLAEDRDPAWVSLVSGTPAWTATGSLVRVVARDGAYRLMIGDELATPTGPDALQVREVLDTGEDVLFTASAQDPTQIHVYTAGPAGVAQVTTVPGMHSATRSGGVTVVRSGSLEWSGPRVHVLRDGEAAGEIGSHAETPVLTPEVTHLTVGEHALRCALLLPRGYKPGSDPALPVLLDPYGGPAGQRVMSVRNIYLEPQWFADQGFAVVVIDGRGTPGRGPDWDRLVQYNQSTPNLEDQADGLAAVAAAHPCLDTSRVAIRGWSHGGYLAALAVLRRPDVFHAAVAGAPVSDERLYDTHYTERFLGLPDEHPEAYEQDSLIADAPKLRRPLMLIHGLADDNVVVAHTLRLSAALLAAGRPHTVLPLTGITHMAAKHEEVAENLLLFQLDFIRRALGITDPA
ncbi:MAG TPA: prolyl oligopeptidase family serine peptidase [Streptosporangiaceae bacterium]|jgi:dipeptidyl-peptidase-4